MPQWTHRHRHTDLVNHVQKICFAESRGQPPSNQSVITMNQMIIILKRMIHFAMQHHGLCGRGCPEWHRRRRPEPHHRRDHGGRLRARRRLSLRVLGPARAAAEWVRTAPSGSLCACVTQVDLISPHTLRIGSLLAVCPAHALSASCMLHAHAATLLHSLAHALAKQRLGPDSALLSGSGKCSI